MHVFWHIEMEVNVAELEKSTKPHAAEYRIRKTQVCAKLKHFN